MQMRQAAIRGREFQLATDYATSPRISTVVTTLRALHWRASYDAQGRVVGVTFPSGGAETYSWDEPGNLLLNHDWNLRVSKYENHLPIKGGIVSG